MNKQSTEFPTKEIAAYFGEVPLYTGKQTGWRTRAKLAVRAGPKIGLFKPGTHDIEDLKGCLDHHPSINEAIEWVRAALIELKIAPYNEKATSGDLRYLQLVVQRSSSKVQLTLVANGLASLPRIEALAHYLWEKHGWHSIWINVQSGSTNTIFGPKWHHLYGEELLAEVLAGRTLYFHPACFVQAHLDLFEKILEEIEEKLLPQKKVAEFYAGVGAIAFAAQDKSTSITLVEINPFAKQCFERSAPPTHLTYIQGAVKEHIDELQKTEVLIVDPPRKGLEYELIKAIADTPLKQILYLSCNFTTLKRDVEQLKRIGWKVHSVSGYDLFPGTPHFELLIVLEKSG